MLLTDYTPARAKALRELQIPVIESPMLITPLLCESMTAEQVATSIRTDRHRHSFFEIHFIFSGQIRYEYGGETAILHEGQALLLAPYVAHRFLACDASLFRVSLGFSMEKRVSLSMPFPERGAICFSFSQDICDSLNYIFRQCERTDILAPTLIGGRILEMLDSVSATLCAHTAGRGTPQFDPRLLAAKRFVESNKYRRITCADVARAACLSEKQLGRIFQKELGQTVADYITEAKLQYAKRLLQKEGYSVKEVGFMLGFENECSFVTFFKRHCGMSPGLFRKWICVDKPKTQDEPY